MPIEQLDPGDLVLDPGGKAHPVVEAYANPPGAVVRVRLSDGRELVTTPGQLFRTVTDDYDLAWVRADELAGKRVLCGQSAESRTLPDSARPEPDVDGGRAAYVAGLLVAEGCPAHRGRAADGRVRIAMTDPEPLEVVRRWARTVGISCTTSTRAPAQEHHLPLEVLSLGRHEATLAMLQPVSADKTVPAWVLADRESWVPFLGGLLDGDGYVRSSSREIVFTTTSRDLAQHAQTMLAGLGLRAGRWTGRPEDEHPEIGVCVNGRDAFELACMLLPWSTIPRKREALELALSPRSHQDKLGADALPVGVFLAEVRRAQVGGGWYRGVDGAAFRARLDPTGSAEVRYGRNRHGTRLEDRSVNLRRMVRSGWLDLLERIGSPLAVRLDRLVGHTFVTVTSVTVEPEAQATYDIQIDSDEHAFLAEGVAVHNCMGKYHPHGDSAIYDAMVRLAQPFSMRVPLIDGHGNWGSPDDGPAASRYTECRLAPAALLLTTGLDEETVDVEDNYDGSLTQPSVLPAAYPNLLVNGAAGIAVGMATNMIPHNLVEVVDAARHLLDHPDADLDALMRFVPGPDLPTGGQLLGMSEVRSAYETGRGVVRMRATADVGPLPRGKSHITVTELPYGVGAERVKAKMKELVGAKKLQGIADVKDLTDRHRGTQLVIEVKAGFNPQAVLAELYRLTPLEESFGINNLALVDGQPRTLGLKELLEVFLAHRVDVGDAALALPAAQGRGARPPGRGPAAGAGQHRRGRPHHPRLAGRRRGAGRAHRADRADRHPGRLRARHAAAPPRRARGAQAGAGARRPARDDRRAAGDPRRPGRAAAGHRRRAGGRRGRARHPSAHGAGGRRPQGAGDRPGRLPRGGRRAGARAAVLGRAAGPHARWRRPATTPRAAPPSGRGTTSSCRRCSGTARGQVGLVTSAGRVLRVGLLDVPAVPGVTTGALSLRGGAPASEFVPLEKGERVLALTTLSTDSEGLALATRLRHGQAGHARLAGQGRRHRGDRAAPRRRGRRRRRARGRRRGARLLHLDRRPAPLPGRAGPPAGPRPPAAWPA